MAEDKVEPREINWRQLMPWTVLFQGFRVALDPNKLVLAAAGILLMAFGWWLLAIMAITSLVMCSLASIASVRSALTVEPGRVFRA